MRIARLIAFAVLATAPVSLPAQTTDFKPATSSAARANPMFVWFKESNRNERWEINDPFGETNDPKKAVWGRELISLDKGSGLVVTKNFSDLIRIDWGENDPPALIAARARVDRGEAAPALVAIESILKKLDPVRKTPGSRWLKAAMIKLDALALLSDENALLSFIKTLEENNDDSIPGLEDKIKLVKIDLRYRKGDYQGVITEATALRDQLRDPDNQARLLGHLGRALMAVGKYDDALTSFLSIPVFYGTEKSLVPGAYLEAAKAFAKLDTPKNHAKQRLDLTSQAYLNRVIADYPLSKEAAEAKKLLPRTARLEADKRKIGEVDPNARPIAAKDAEDAQSDPDGDISGRAE